MSDYPTTSTATIAARLTAEIPAAIATIAVLGRDALSMVWSHVRTSTTRPKLGRIYYGTWQLSERGDSEQVVICHTDERTVEIHCHGGNAVCRAILDSLAQAGCHVIAAHAWPAPGRSDAGCGSIARAAEQDLLLATTDRSAAILLDQLNGALESEIRWLVAGLKQNLIAEAERRLEALHYWSRLGLRLSAPWRVVLVGPPNAGKSSLINAVAGRQQSIVHHEPGTTRDWVEALTAVEGWPVSLTDTAGIRDSENAIEAEGISRAHQRLATADLVVLVVDAAMGWTSVHAEVAEVVKARDALLLIAWNKADLEPAPPASLAQIAPVVATSAVGLPGIDGLLRQLGRLLVPESPSVGTAIPFRQLQVDSLWLAQQALGRGAIPQAVSILENLLADQN